MGWDAPWHWVVLAIIVIALFASKRMPDAARSLGRSLRIFKTEMKGMGEDDKKRTVKEEPKAIESAPTRRSDMATEASRVSETADTAADNVADAATEAAAVRQAESRSSESAARAEPRAAE